MVDLDASKSISIAEKALEKGDYNKCLLLLKEVSKDPALSNKEHGKVQLLLVTAYMGQGEDQKAISICKNLLNSQTISQKENARYLLSILQAPTLKRPEEWSVKLPSLGKDSDQKITYNIAKNNQSIKLQEAPPTGPTKGLGLGYTAVALAIFFALTILLSGCVHFSTEIQIKGPDKLKMAMEIESNSERILPWQNQFESSLKKLDSKISIVSTPQGRQLIQPASMNSKDTNRLLQEMVGIATNLAGFKIAPPQITLKEKNFFIGVKQKLSVLIDLRDLPNVPGLSMSMTTNRAQNKNAMKGSPLPIILNNSNVNWELKKGVTNELEVNIWHWSKLGIGVILVAFVLTLVIVLQKLRIKMGYGFPELPP